MHAADRDGQAMADGVTGRGGREARQEGRLDRLGLVDDRFSANLNAQSSNRATAAA